MLIFARREAASITQLASGERTERTERYRNRNAQQFPRREMRQEQKLRLRTGLDLRSTNVVRTASDLSAIHTPISQMLYPLHLVSILKCHNHSAK